MAFIAMLSIRASTLLAADFPPELIEQCNYLQVALANYEARPDIQLEIPYHVSSGIKTSRKLTRSGYGWIAHIFPYEVGGIAARWQVGKNSGRYELLNVGPQGGKMTRGRVLQKLKQMSKEEINKLSPVEKLDIWLGRYTFPATRIELENRGPKRDPAPASWEGFCNGVCAASLAQKEPKRRVTVQNEDGIKVVFEPSDIKALLVASYFYVERYAQVGLRPERLGLPVRVENLPNPVALDLAATKVIGEAGRGFALQLNPTWKELWNWTIIGYERELEKPRALRSRASFPPDAAWLVKVRLKLIASNLVVSAEQANRPESLSARERQEAFIYEYDLVLDQEHRVIDGRYADIQTAPGMIWFSAGRGMDHVDGVNPKLPFDRIQELVQKAR